MFEANIYISALTRGSEDILFGQALSSYMVVNMINLPSIPLLNNCWWSTNSMYMHDAYVYLTQLPKLHHVLLTFKRREFTTNSS